jgi:hypothetical protein
VFLEREVSSEDPMNHRLPFVLPVIALASAIGVARDARAADPSVPECLAESEASLKSGSEHRLRDERTHVLVCAAASCPAEIRKECARRVDELNAAIPRIVFRAKDASGDDLTAVKVSMDGEALTDHLDGVALAVDPGAHRFTFRAAGQPTLEKTFVIGESQRDRVELIEFSTIPTPYPPGLGPEAVPSGSAGPKAKDQGMGASTVLAIVAAGIGAAGLGAGAVLGLETMSKRDSAEKVCPNACADQNGVNAWKDAQTWGDYSTIAFIVGGVGTTAALLSLLVSPESASPKGAKVDVGLGGFRVSGRW